MALVGRADLLDRVVRLVVDGRLPDDPDPGQRPALLLVGPGGSGRTAVLAEVAARLGEEPHVRRDVHELKPEAGVLDLLSALVVDFGRLATRWSFSRFVVGRLVTTMALPANDLRAQADKVRRELARVKNTTELTQQLDALLSEPLRALGLPTIALQPMARVLLAGLSSGRFGGRLTLRAGQHWYGHQDRGLRNDPVMELVSLNDQWRYAGDAGRDRVVEVLFEAFLADVRATTRRGSSLDPVLLLDNADREPALEFLRLYRQERPEPTRLTVVATGRAAGAAGVTLPLRDLTDTEMFDLTSALKVPADQRDRLVQVLRPLTRGHPGATTALARAALAAAPNDACPGQLLSRLVVDDRAPRQAPRPVVELIEGMLLPPPGTSSDNLAVLSAARDWAEAEVLASSESVLVSGTHEEKLALIAALFEVGTGDRRTMHPLTRALLHRRLAALPPGHFRSWNAVHRYLAQADPGPAGSPPRVRALPHLLSVGEVREVAVKVTEALTSTDGAEWLEHVRDLATAPAPPAADCAPVWSERLAAAKETLADLDPVTAGVGTLVLAWQGVNDPFAVTERADLHAIVAAELLAVLKHSAGGYAELVEESKAHQDAVRAWRHITCPDHEKETA
ncbi:hypothetical protein JOD54_006348 [Actinokineospora baliensis]|uniref:hypothetical protein n=1 Tax=Actinokineospora baliensis TaxID=547056 RepID=UPI0019567718|nr:hypothetical protein [Actinokineospora baliensis]MBM7776144.1 hypothetical protein [Actinokineospora baliensis]